MTEKKVSKRKVVSKKAKPKSAFEMLESSVVGKPIKIANRTFLASLGLVSTMQTEFTKFQTDFEKKFEKLVKDGEKARNRYRKDLKGFREDVKDFGDDVIGVARVGGAPPCVGDERCVGLIEESLEPTGGGLIGILGGTCGHECCLQLFSS